MMEQLFFKGQCKREQSQVCLNSAECSLNSIFYQLIRVSIGTQVTLSRPPSAVEWKELYAMAKKQSLVGICFAGLQKLYYFDNQEPSTHNPQPDSTPDPIPQNHPQDITHNQEPITKNHPQDITHNPEPITQNLDEVQYFTWMGMAAQINMKNELVNRQCVEIQQTIEKAGFRTFIMKGQGNSALYRASYEDHNENDNLCLLRQSGDIDIFLDGGFDKVMKFVNETRPTKEVNELEIHYHCFSDPSTGSGEPTEVEIHYRPFIMRNPFKNRKLQSFFKEAMRFDNKVTLPNDAGEISVPTAEFNLVHQMVHIYHHLITEGVGMRQLMDYYMVLRTVSSSKVSSSKVQDVIHELGLDRFASALMWVIAHVFANDNDNTNANWLLWEPCEEDGRLLLEEIERSGNFGHHDETKANLSNKWKSFWYVNGKTFRFWRFDHWAWFWSPLWRTYHFAWRKINGFE